METSPEYLLLEAYCSSKRRQKERRSKKTKKVFYQQYNLACAASTLGENIFPEGLVLRATHTPTGEHDECGDVADKLTCIVDNTRLEEDIDRDSSDTDVIQRLVELLKKHGDELNEEIQKDHELLGYLQNSFTYNVFESVVSAVVSSVVPTNKQKEEAAEEGTVKQKAAIAWTFETTSRLRALHLHPMTRVMGFGAQYLQQHFAPWIQRNGGWEKVFNSDDNEVQ